MKLKLIFSFFLLLFLLAVGHIWWNYYFVFGEGVKSGDLNYVVYKGNIFKTYEGKMIQNGLKSAPGTAVQSNDFIFSIENEEIAKKLMNMGNKQVDLYYKEYKKTLPWRGNSNFVVDSFNVRVENISINTNELLLGVGATEVLNAAVYPDEAHCNRFNWSSTNNAVAIVSQNGEVKAVAPGKTTITVSAEGHTASCYVVVRSQAAIQQESRIEQSYSEQEYDPIEAERYLQNQQ